MMAGEALPVLAILSSAFFDQWDRLLDGGLDFLDVQIGRGSLKCGRQAEKEYSHNTNATRFRHIAPADLKATCRDRRVLGCASLHRGYPLAKAHCTTCWTGEIHRTAVRIALPALW